MAARASESGNVLVYILLAVALLAALSFAVTQGSRDSTSGLSADKQKLLATEIIDYGDTVQKAVVTLRLRGTAFSALRFSDAGLSAAYGVPGAAAADEVFNSAGGGVLYKDVTAEALAVPAQSYVFSAGNEIKGVGTSCAAADCTELLIMLPNLRKDICVAINALIGVPNPDGAPPADSHSDDTPFAGTAVYAQTIGDEAGSAGLEGKTAGCFEDLSSSTYIYYEVLQPR